MIIGIHLESHWRAMEVPRHILISLLALIGTIMPCIGETDVIAMDWGLVDGCMVEKYRLQNNGYEVDIITYGATVSSIRAPDRFGNIADVVLGFGSIEGYVSEQNPYLGATVGRVANRVGKAEFNLDGRKYRLAKNAGNNSLHGGYKGWSSKIWRATVGNGSVTMTLLSEDGEEGYPGAALAAVTFSLNFLGGLKIEMKVFVTKASPINLTNHSYFNLAGHNTSATELYNHRVIINADRWTVTDSDSIPTGELRAVAGSPMDLRNATLLGDVINQVPGGGYDYNYCLPQLPAKEQRALVSRVEHEKTGRFLEVYSNQPGVQFYTANFLPAVGSTPVLEGKDGARYYKHGAFCLETQNYPDAVNHENFPNSVLMPGNVYEHLVIYKFGVMA